MSCVKYGSRPDLTVSRRGRSTAEHANSSGHLLQPPVLHLLEICSSAALKSKHLAKITIGSGDIFIFLFFYVFLSVHLYTLKGKLAPPRKQRKKKERQMEQISLGVTQQRHLVPPGGCGRGAPAACWPARYAASLFKSRWLINEILTAGRTQIFITWLPPL